MLQTHYCDDSESILCVYPSSGARCYSTNNSGYSSGVANRSIAFDLSIVAISLVDLCKSKIKEVYYAS